MSFVWYAVEFTTYVCIIAYTCYTFGIMKPLKMYKNESPATFGDTIKSANSIIGTAGKFAATFQKALEQGDEESSEDL